MLVELDAEIIDLTADISIDYKPREPDEILRTRAFTFC
jgi:hypothetical protein